MNRGSISITNEQELKEQWFYIKAFLDQWK